MEWAGSVISAWSNRPWKTWIHSGRPFMTSGCPGGGLETACNRPFGDGPPSDIRSYPFPLEPGDVARVKEQMGWGGS